MLRLLGVLADPWDAHSILLQVSFFSRLPLPLSALELLVCFSLSILTDIVGPSASAFVFFLRLIAVFAFVAFPLLVQLVVRISFLVFCRVGYVLLRLYVATAAMPSLFSSLLLLVMSLRVVTFSFLSPFAMFLVRHRFLFS